MTLDMNTFYKIVIPSKMWPTYVHEEQKLNKKHSFKWTFKVDLKTNRKVSFWKSPSHQLNLIS